MPEIENYQPGSAVYGRGDGGGDASVLDHHGDGGLNQLYGHALTQAAAEKARQDLAAAQKLKKDEAVWKDIYQKMQTDPVWDRSEEQKVKNFEMQAGLLGKWKASGGDPENITTEAGKAYKQFERQNLLLHNMDTAAKVKFEAAVQKMKDSPGKYDAQHFKDVYDRFDAIRGENGIEERDKFMSDPSNVWLKPVASIEDISKNTLPGKTKSGNVSFVDPDLHRDSAAIHFASPEGQEEMNYLLSTGTYGKTPNEVIEKVVEIGQLRNPKQVGKASKDSESGGSQYTFGAGGDKNLVVDFASSYETSQGQADTANFTLNNKPLPAFPYTDEKGNTVNMANVGARVDEQGKFYLEGDGVREVTRVTFDPQAMAPKLDSKGAQVIEDGQVKMIPDVEAKRSALARQYGVDPEKVQVDGTDLVIYRPEGGKRKVVLDESPIGIQNKSALRAVTGGFDFDTALSNYNKKAKPKAKSAEKSSGKKKYNSNTGMFE